MNHLQARPFLYLGLSLIVAASILSCKPTATKQTIKTPALLLTGDSGYVTKKQALPFLLASGFTNTVNDYWMDILPNDNDTIGKYYPSNIAGNHMLLIRLYSIADTSDILMVIESGNSGATLKKEVYKNIIDGACADAVRAFHKKGRYFMITECGHGTGYASECRYVFDRVIPQAKIIPIWFAFFSTAVRFLVNRGILLPTAILMILHFYCITPSKRQRILQKN